MDKTETHAAAIPRTALGSVEAGRKDSLLPRDKKLPRSEEPTRDGIAGANRAGGKMLMRSTGLGKAELVAEIVGLERQGDYLIMHLQTVQPVRWKIRGGLSHQDLRMLLKAMAKLSVLGFLFNVRAWFRSPKHPGDF